MPHASSLLISIFIFLTSKGSLIFLIAKQIILKCQEGGNSTRMLDDGVLNNFLQINIINLKYYEELCLIFNKNFNKYNRLSPQ